MKTIYSKNYMKIVYSQEENDEEIFIDRRLPEITEKDLPGILEDDIDDKIEPLDEEVVIEEIPGIPEEEIPEFANQYDALEWSEDNNEIVQINYTTKYGRNLIREIEPHGSFYSSSTHRNILVSFDRTVNGIRAFIIRNINDLNFTGRKFSRKFTIGKM